MNGMPWFRMFYEARTDEKLRILSDAQHRVWFRLLCLAAEQRTGRGTIPPMDDFLLAVECANGDACILRDTIDLLVKLRMLSEDTTGLTFMSFEKRQYDKPSDVPAATAARQAAKRSRDRGTPTGSVTPLSRDVTPHHAIEKIRLDTETDTEQRETATASLPVALNGNGHAASDDAVMPTSLDEIGVVIGTGPDQTAGAPAWPDSGWIDDAFEHSLWPAYPRKTHKAEAKMAWRKLMKRQRIFDHAFDLAEQILEALRDQSDAWTDPAVTPHAATYLNGERWNDEHIIPTSRARTRAAPAQRWPS